MKFKLILGILFGLFIAINIANAGPLMNCTVPGNVWNTTTANLMITYDSVPIFTELPPKIFYNMVNFGNYKMQGGNAKQSMRVYIRNDEAFNIAVVNVYKPGTYNTTNWAWQQSPNQQDINAFPALGMNANPALAGYVDFVIDTLQPTNTFTVPFNENVTVGLEATSGPCTGQSLNITVNLRGVGFQNTFVSHIPGGYTAEWNLTGLDATTNDSGPNNDNLTIYGPDGGAIIIADVTPNLLSPQAVDLGSLSATVNPTTKKILVKFDWATNAPEATSHYLLVRRGLNKTGPWLCDSSSLNTISDVVPGCDGYNASPAYFVLRYGDVEPYSYFYAMLTSHSGAGTFANASLITADEYEGTSVNTSTNIAFYAYYYNNSSLQDTITPSENGGCWIEFDDTWGTKYQENGNATACAGNWSDTAPCSSVYDGNFGTIGGGGSSTEDALFYVNYTKPTGVAIVKWLIKDTTGTSTNLTLPSGCISDSNVRLLVNLSWGTAENNFDCWNYTSSTWSNLYTDTSGSASFYEEGMYWGPAIYSMSGWNGTHYSYTKTGGFATEAIHKWNVTCNDSTGTFATVQDVQDDVNISGARPCALNSSCDLACGGPGTGYTNDGIMCYSNSGCSAVCTGTCAPESTCDSACSPYYGFSPDYGATCYPSFYCLEECSAGPAVPVPEFSDFAWVLAAVLGAGSFVLMRRMKKF